MRKMPRHLDPGTGGGQQAAEKRKEGKQATRPFRKRPRVSLSPADQGVLWLLLLPRCGLGIPLIAVGVAWEGGALQLGALGGSGTAREKPGVDVSVSGGRQLDSIPGIVRSSIADEGGVLKWLLLLPPACLPGSFFVLPRVVPAYLGRSFFSIR